MMSSQLSFLEPKAAHPEGFQIAVLHQRDRQQDIHSMTIDFYRWDNIATNTLRIQGGISTIRNLLGFKDHRRQSVVFFEISDHIGITGRPQKRPSARTKTSPIPGISKPVGPERAHSLFINRPAPLTHHSSRRWRPSPVATEL
jgi:hypothetical protein